MNLDHPCKETCSGWKQGFERGVESMSGVSKQRIRFSEEIAEVKKHRQFWITISENYNRPPYLDSHRAYECEQKLFDNIHVIEISAVKDLEAENTDLRDTLNKINNCKVGDLVVYHPVKNPDADNIFDSINQMNKEIEKLNKLLDKAVEALESQPRYDISVNPPVETHAFRKAYSALSEIKEGRK